MFMRNGKFFRYRYDKDGPGKMDAFTQVNHLFPEGRKQQLDLKPEANPLKYNLPKALAEKRQTRFYSRSK